MREPATQRSAANSNPGHRMCTMAILPRTVVFSPIRAIAMVCFFIHVHTRLVNTITHTVTQLRICAPCRAQYPMLFSCVGMSKVQVHLPPPRPVGDLHPEVPMRKLAPRVPSHSKDQIISSRFELELFLFFFFFSLLISLLSWRSFAASALSKRDLAGSRRMQDALKRDRQFSHHISIVTYQP